MPVGPVIALSHGGGPMPLLDDPAHAAITASLRTRIPSLLNLNPNPNLTHTSPSPSPSLRAIILVTAHWRTPTPRISSAPSHPLLYDYHGFPPSTYALSHPARGDPALARSVAAALAAEGFSPVLDEERGWDHGVFVPMMLADPGARVPVVQVSVLEGDDAGEHFRMGRALGRLRGEGVAVVGSGFASVHNFEGFGALRGGGGEGEMWAGKVDVWNEALGKALRGDAHVGKSGSGSVGEGEGEGGSGRRGKGGDGERGKVRSEVEEALRGWRGFPHAWDMHPRGRAEHLMPLMVCAGAAMEGEGVGWYEDEFMGARMRTFYWGADLAA